MFDIATISTAVSSVKTAINIAKLIKESSGSLQKAELDLKLAELITSLADVKLQMADIKDALLESENEKKELKAKLALQAKLEFEMPYYWTIEEDGKKDGPFCQRCYDNEKKLIRLQNKKNGQWHCLACNSHFQDKNYRYQPIRIANL
ncbi:hypothetical protein [Sulfurospirillum sp. hDNRA2]|uniref:hypothetical protein n=1 Tax=Sulfurospirillum sp. hDNRA2 TaxID=3237298 RepID=UPI0020B654D6|nr:hypothetical protein [Sulfurospirillum sp. DNRA8]MCP3652952.1 hypothetical protein [Sulfurospirillum sp. DNRA8]MCR1811804.1 hypothetical protein [Sulfurospirillum sp. DNRA8]